MLKTLLPLLATSLLWASVASADTAMNCQLYDTSIPYATDGESIWYNGLQLPHRFAGTSATIVSQVERGIWTILLSALDGSETVVVNFNNLTLTVDASKAHREASTVVCTEI